MISFATERMPVSLIKWYAFKASPFMCAAVVVYATVLFTMPDVSSIGVDARVLGCVEGVTATRITSYNYVTVFPESVTQFSLLHAGLD